MARAGVMVIRVYSAPLPRRGGGSIPYRYTGTEQCLRFIPNTNSVIPGDTTENLAQWWDNVGPVSLTLNPLSAKLFNLNFHPLEVASR